MDRINYLATLAYVKAITAVDDFKNDERGVEGFVVALILIGIAAILALTFKDEIGKIMTGLIDKIKDLLEIS